MFYATECWTINKKYVNKMSVTEMRILRWMNRKTRNNRIKNESICVNLNITSIGDKMKENRLK